MIRNEDDIDLRVDRAGWPHDFGILPARIETHAAVFHVRLAAFRSDLPREVANDMTGKPSFEPSLEVERPAPIAEPKVAAAAVAPKAEPVREDAMADVKRLIGELTETVRQQQEEITALRKLPKQEAASRPEPFKQAANGDAQGWMPGSRNGHQAPVSPAAPSGVRNMDEIRFSGAPSGSGLHAPSMSAASGAAEAGPRLRSYHDMPNLGGRNGTAPAMVIPMPSLSHMPSAPMSHGALAAKLVEPAPIERPVLDALIEASLNRDVTPIAPIVAEVTPVEPFEEWAPAPGLDADEAPRAPVSSLEDIQRFIDRSRETASAADLEPIAEVDEIMPELAGEDDEHPTENADVNVPMITQWWTRKS